MEYEMLPKNRSILVRVWSELSAHVNHGRVEEAVAAVETGEASPELAANWLLENTQGTRHTNWVASEFRRIATK